MNSFEQSGMLVMRLRAAFILAAALTFAILGSSAARADYLYRDGSSPTLVFPIHDFICQTKHCPLQVPSDLTGNPFGVSGNPFFVTPDPGAIFWPYTLNGDGGVPSHVMNFPSGFNVNNFPGTWAVTGTFWPYTLNGDGGVPSHVTNFPSGFNVNNFPGTWAVTGTFWPYTLNGDGGVPSHVTNFPSGFNVNNFPSTQVVAEQPVTWTQTVVTLGAGSSQTLVAQNSSRNGLRWMVTGINPMTVVPGAVSATVNQGMNYNPPTASGFQGGSEAFPGDLAQQAFSAISQNGTTVTVWEGN